MVPITGEKEFIGLLGRMKLKTEAVKDKPGTYTLQLPEHIVFPKASTVHIAGAWAHVSLNAGDAVDAKDLIPPETLIDNADPALITAKLYPDRVPDKLVKTTLDQMDQAAAMVKGFVGGAGATQLGEAGRDVLRGRPETRPPLRRDRPQGGLRARRAHHLGARRRRQHL